GLGVCYEIHEDNVSTAYDAPERRRGFDLFTRKHGLRIRIANHLAIHRQLMSVPEGWSEVENALEREFRFDDFARAIAFVNRVAELAEGENHHPDVEIHYNRVTLRWSTHSAGGITDRDRELASRSAELACASGRARRPTSHAGCELAADLPVRVLGRVHVHVEVVLRERALERAGDLRRALGGALARGA